jgi:hypothetical protein
MYLNLKYKIWGKFIRKSNQNTKQKKRRKEGKVHACPELLLRRAATPPHKYIAACGKSHMVVHIVSIFFHM